MRFLRVWRHGMVRMWRVMFDIFREFIFSKLLYIPGTDPTILPIFPIPPWCISLENIFLLQIVYKFSLKARWIICSHFRHLHIQISIYACMKRKIYEQYDWVTKPASFHRELRNHICRPLFCISVNNFYHIYSTFCKNVKLGNLKCRFW